MTTRGTYTFRDLLTFMETVKDGDTKVSVVCRFAGFIGSVPIKLTVGNYHGHLAKADEMSLDSLDEQATLIFPDAAGRAMVTYHIRAALICDNCDDVHLGVAPSSEMDALLHISMFDLGVPFRDALREDVGPGTTEERPVNPVARSMSELFGKQIDPDQMPDIPEDFDFDRIPESRRGQTA